MQSSVCVTFILFFVLFCFCFWKQEYYTLELLKGKLCYIHDLRFFWKNMWNLEGVSAWVVWGDSSKSWQWSDALNSLCRMVLILTGRTAPNPLSPIGSTKSPPSLVTVFLLTLADAGIEQPVSLFCKAPFAMSPLVSIISFNRANVSWPSIWARLHSAGNTNTNNRKSQLLGSLGLWYKVK